MQIRFNVKNLVYGVVNRNTLFTYFGTLFSIFVLYILFYINDDLESFTSYIWITSGWIIGVTVGTLIGYLLLENLRFRTLTVILVSYTIAQVITILALILSGALGLGGLDSDFPIGFILGAIIAGLVHIGFSRFRSLIFIIAFIIPSIVVYGGLDDYVTERQKFALIFMVIVFTITLALAVIYFSKQYRVSKNSTLRTIKPIYLFPLLLLLIGIGALTVYVSDYIYDLYSQVQEIKEEQFDEQAQRQPVEPQPYPTEEGGKKNESDLNYDERKKEININIVGYYQAEEPTYLKIDVFNLKSNLYGLTIETPYRYFTQYDTFGYLSNYKLDQREVKVVYKYDPIDKLVPTAGSIDYFENEWFSYSDGLFQKPYWSKDGVAFLEYWYSEDTYKGVDLDFNSEFYVDSTYFGSDYTVISKDSDRHDEIRELALEITKGKESKYDKAKAIESYFIESYEYSFSPNIQDQDAPIDDFILDTKTGYCTHFATSMVYMLDTLGIDARLVGGYYATAYDPNLDAFVITSDRLHAWVEAYIGGDWVMFDPTTGNLAPEMEPFMATGGNTEEISWDEYKINYNLQSVDPTVSFDNIFDLQDSSQLELEEYGFDDAENDWKEEEKEEKEEEKAEEEEEEEEEKTEVQKDLDELRRILMIIFILISILVISIILIMLGIKLYKNREYYRKKYIEKKTRSYDNRFRRRYAKSQNLTDPKLESYSPKEFLKLASHNMSITNDIKEFYNTIDEILYSESPYRNASFKDLKESYNKIKK
jgi:transglutaminase-like putative cysteine protease